MTRALLRTTFGRKGSVYGTTGIVLLAVLAFAVGLTIVHVLRPGRNPSIGGQPMLDGMSAAVFLLGGVGAIVIGALAGSYDASQGTMRYLVLTGARRLGVYAARTAALLITIVAVLAPGLALGVLATYVLPHGAEAEVKPSELADVLWTCLLWPVVFGLIAMGIGSLLRSNGGAVAIALFFAFAGTPLLGLVSLASKTLGDLMLLPALDRVTGGDDSSVSVAAAAVAVTVWVAAFWTAGALRVQRDEY